MGNPLRVLHAVVNMNRGGAETLIMNLYRNIDRTKVQFDFLTNRQGVFDEEIIEMGGKVHRIPYLTDIGHFKYVDALNGFFKQNSGYRIIHSHMDKMSGLVLRASKKHKIPHRIAHSHNTRSEGGKAARVYKWYAGTRIKQNATHLFACSNEAAQWLFSQDAQKARVLNNGIEPEKFLYTRECRNAVRKELNIEDNTFVMGHVGRFAPQKNHSFLIELFSEYHKINKRAVLLLAGDGVLRQEMEKKVQQLNLNSSVKFLGIRNDVQRLYQVFDVFVFPSLHEGLPVTLIEAQGTGLPCMISDTITKQADLGLNLVNFLPLDNKKNWLDKLQHYTQCMSKDRSIESNAFASRGFDIRETARQTQETYLLLGGGAR
ncbi:glycosyltransferase family 1 protein [Fictibacillus fluitans]|uniref:Glycosyltransferase family 1 protein n=1 Tax=Fictibacillus fluitans TaxID=3058422 RepID=A0ABT8I130_9BACL|nr:glycosyltransferase family 1 protein [Fictibacillus sp. NE201]MDN4526734.1 glycosyltransferase family 1 protein [Fictibacillus sp. NE201]